ncbi:hypothetical protein INT48_004815 [Thamnidium elegans]|uniref:CTLH domain-containing protein n=1 Tax=Thamnidium elegans TaxID=101142 RepID=A0A8H7SP75_9FUNG|nr:hypothetical protein INT48_004815 [Thamnidium elegans]
MRFLDNCIKPEDNKDIQTAIQQGDITEAFTLIESHFPQLVKTYEHYNQSKSYQTPPRSHYILYKLRCQQFIETLRSSGDMEAIAFAQRYLRPCYEYYADYMNNVAVLMAYKDLENDTTRDLFGQHRRDSIADEVNEMILESRQTALEKLKRQNAIVQIELESQIRQDLLKNQKEAEVVEKVSM